MSLNIHDLSIAELKAAYDFVVLDIASLEDAAKKKKVEPTSIPAYNEVKEVESRLYSELLNKTRLLTWDKH